MQYISNCGFVKHPEFNISGGAHCCKLFQKNDHECLKEPYTTDIVISINIYRNPQFLNEQLKNISQYVKSTYAVILNCNDLMLAELMETRLAPNVFINPEPINKKRFHGSLTKGIVSNMQYALNNFTFRYFVVLSARTVFYRDLCTSNLDELNKYLPDGISKKSDYSLEQIKSDRVAKMDLVGWQWPSLKNSLLVKYYLNKGFKLHKGAHEGLCFSKDVVNNIIKFLTDNNKIKEELFILESVVEEFALQSIAMNEISEGDYAYLYIGNGCYNAVNMELKDRYVKKIPFS